MIFKFIGNASGIFYGSRGTKILCDPWVNDGVFEGSWFHYPPLNTKIKDLQNVDAIYLSHIHPDHYDERYFDFPKNIPIIILNEGPNFLKKNLIKKGYNNLIEIKDSETKNFSEFKLTMYKPFVGHIYEESILGNLIDSAIVFQDENQVAINFNDNVPDIKACKKLNKKFKNIDLALLPYNAAGPYPSCFDNLKNKDKKKEHMKILKKNFDHLCKIVPTLKPKTLLPFAGSYILGGKNAFKNDYLGTTTTENCAKYLKKNIKFKTNLICLNENQKFDLLTRRTDKKYKKIDKKNMNE